MMNLDAHLRASQAALLARVSRQTFNYWRKSGKIAQVGTDKNGHALYRAGDVLVVERDMRNAKQSSRRLTLAAA
jgi:DNA-binding transcriptional MerR regulator